ncbi:MAG: DUF1735 domain-containing protein [Bacteroidota bacterium]|nr:DUF1735 domain-containing protein [Bacteroidota bacterium]
MTRLNKNIFYFITLLTVFVYLSCDKGDNQKPWGISKIYMPQASIMNGGSTNIYAVPLNNGINNYAVDTVKNTIDIDLGVYRSGLETLNSFTVKVAADVDTTNSIIAGGSIANAALLPADVYSIPSSITVPDGKREATFHLTIDRAKLIANYGSYYNKKLVLTVRISNPTRYELNQSLSRTVVVINAATFMPVPPVINLLKGSDMSAASAAYWTIVPQDNGIGSGRTPSNIVFNGVLSWSNGTGNVTSNDAVYQAFQVTAGKKYRFSADVTSTGTANNSSFEMFFGATKPSSGGQYSDNYYIGFNTWTAGACSKTPITKGNMADVGCIGPGVGQQGLFTATVTGTIYFVIKGCSYGGNLGTITLDNITISEEP